MTAANENIGGRTLTGRAVLIWLIAFFGIVGIVNAIMAREAISTFGGLETASSYQAGLKFEQDAADARAQDARHWHVKANVRLSGGKTLFDIDARDAAGVPLAGLAATAVLHHPTDARGDHLAKLSEDTAGHFRTTIEAATGQWDLVIELSRGEERLFRSRNRVVLQ
jgi:nitrogen fixation protein FixH